MCGTMFCNSKNVNCNSIFVTFKSFLVLSYAKINAIYCIIYCIKLNSFISELITIILNRLDEGLLIIISSSRIYGR